jgi:rubrerythrin
MSGIIAENTATVANLLTAFEGESDANAKYKAFAAKADSDGWHGAASLFRAAACAEQIHAANHARVIRELGGEAHCEIPAVDVRTTLDNLKTALAGEQYEVDILYPGFLKEAIAGNNTPAVRTFRWAIEAEKSHARLYREAIALLESGNKNSRAASEHNFYVCAVCGHTSERPVEHERCPVCNLAWERFEVIR